MQKTLKLINQEIEKNYDGGGRLVSSLEKKYFDYHCHEDSAPCQLKPVVCRVIDLFNPDAEAQWETDESGCSKCFGVNDRALEELYSRSA